MPCRSTVSAWCVRTTKYCWAAAISGLPGVAVHRDQIATVTSQPEFNRDAPHLHPQTNSPGRRRNGRRIIIGLVRDLRKRLGKMRIVQFRPAAWARNLGPFDRLQEVFPPLIPEGSAQVPGEPECSPCSSSWRIGSKGETYGPWAPASGNGPGTPGASEDASEMVLGLALGIGSGLSRLAEVYCRQPFPLASVTPLFRCLLGRGRDVPLAQEVFDRGDEPLFIEVQLFLGRSPGACWHGSCRASHRAFGTG